MCDARVLRWLSLLPQPVPRGESSPPHRLRSPPTRAQSRARCPTFRPPPPPSCLSDRTAYFPCFLAFSVLARTLAGAERNMLQNLIHHLFGRFVVLDLQPIFRN